MLKENVFVSFIEINWIFELKKNIMNEKMIDAEILFFLAIQCQNQSGSFLCNRI